MAWYKNLIGVLFGKKEPVKTEEQQNLEIAEVRSRSMDITDKLKTAKKALEESELPEEKLEIYNTLIDAFIMDLQEMKTSDEDTAEVDRFLMNFSDMLPEAVQKEDTESIGDILRGVDVGVRMRSQIVNDQRTADGATVGYRLRPMLLAANNSMLISDNNAQIALKNQLLDELREKLKKLMDQIAEFEEKYPEIENRILCGDPSELKANDREVLEYGVLTGERDILQKREIEICKSIADLKKDIHDLENARYQILNNQEFDHKEEKIAELKEELARMVKECERMEAQRVQWRLELEAIEERFWRARTFVDPREIENMQKRIVTYLQEKEREIRISNERKAARAEKAQEQAMEQAMKQEVLEEPVMLQDTAEPTSMAEDLYEEVLV